MNSFPDTIELRDAGMSGTSRIFTLTHSFRMHTSNHGTIAVPAGFNTDGASIPQVFWNIIGPFGPYFASAIIHDFLYSKSGFFRYPHITRKQADDIFLEGMKKLGVAWWQRRSMHLAVRTFGWRSYRKS